MSSTTRSAGGGTVDGVDDGLLEGHAVLLLGASVLPGHPTSHRPCQLNNHAAAPPSPSPSHRGRASANANTAAQTYPLRPGAPGSGGGGHTAGAAGVIGNAPVADPGLVEISERPTGPADREEQPRPAETRRAETVAARRDRRPGRDCRPARDPSPARRGRASANAPAQTCPFSPRPLPRRYRRCPVEPAPPPAARRPGGRRDPPPSPRSRASANANAPAQTCPFRPGGPLESR